jgi:hypothetical protein
MPVGRQVGHDVAVDRHEPQAALGPERREDAGGARTPVVADHHGTIDLQGIEQGDLVQRHGRLLGRARCIAVDEARRAMAPQVRHDDAAAAGGQ